MKIRVSRLTDVMCDKCGGTTRLSPEFLYDTIKDFACNCPRDGELFGREDVDKLEDKPVDNEPKPLHNSKVAKAANREKKSQSKMFEEEPKNVFDAEEDDLDEHGVRIYLRTLKWQELLEAGKNNDVQKPPEMKREEFEELIISKVFHDE